MQQSHPPASVIVAEATSGCSLHCHCNSVDVRFLVVVKLSLVPEIGARNWQWVPRPLPLGKSRRNQTTTISGHTERNACNWIIPLAISSRQTPKKI